MTMKQYYKKMPLHTTAPEYFKLLQIPSRSNPISVPISPQCSKPIPRLSLALIKLREYSHRRPTTSALAQFQPLTLSSLHRKSLETYPLCCSLSFAFCHSFHRSFSGRLASRQVSLLTGEGLLGGYLVRHDERCEGDVIGALSKEVEEEETVMDSAVPSDVDMSLRCFF